MSEKEEDNIINFPNQEITDEDFQVFLNALFNPKRRRGRGTE